MFTGLVEEIGTVKRLWREREGWWLAVRAERVLLDLAVSHSIAVNGTCLTVTDLNEAAFTVGLAAETVRRTNLSDFAAWRGCQSGTCTAGGRTRWRAFRAGTRGWNWRHSGDATRG